jgi:hypothetical protein
VTTSQDCQQDRRTIDLELEQLPRAVAYRVRSGVFKGRPRLNHRVAVRLYWMWRQGWGYEQWPSSWERTDIPEVAVEHRRNVWSYHSLSRRRSIGTYRSSLHFRARNNAAQRLKCGAPELAETLFLVIQRLPIRADLNFRFFAVGQDLGFIRYKLTLLDQGLNLDHLSAAGLGL